MIIQCKQCETTYRFDSAHLRNAEAGEREADVRCVRCGHIFKVGDESDLGENYLHQKPSSPLTAQTATPQQDTPWDEISDETHDALGHDPTADFTFAMGKEADTPLETTADASTTDAFHFTVPSEFALDPADAAPEPPIYDTPSANEFIFEPLRAQDHDADEHTSTSEDDRIAPNLSEDSPPATSPKRVQKKKTSKLLLFVLLLVLVFAGVYAYYFLVHGTTSLTQVINTIEEQVNRIIDPLTEPSGPSIQIQTRDNFYISNNHLGSIFVINGTVTNTSDLPQGEIAVIATLYSASGATLRSTKVYCGNPIGKEELRAEPFEAFQKHMDNKLGAELSNVSVRPGESIPFSVVFHDLPDNFVEFSISPAPLAVMNK
ncbi:MAG: DUF3426 domain-containing protein [Desulfuromonadaceae bacterium]|nr:DUF3426 domain-containing protein [Desulfuromonadaceae bacterium]